jgi:hypothetical protein
MSRELKKGERVRVTVSSRRRDYLAGEAGEIITGPEFLPRDRRRYYLVRMDRPGHSTTAVFAEDEIEADTGA